jgi:hypothetical protein
MKRPFFRKQVNKLRICRMKLTAEQKEERLKALKAWRQGQIDRCPLWLRLRREQLAVLVPEYCKRLDPVRAEKLTIMARELPELCLLAIAQHATLGTWIFDVPKNRAPSTVFYL